MKTGLFISFEGGEGAGKTTQIKTLKDTVEAAGHEVLLTREPGGTPEAEKIRNLLVQRDGGNWDGITELLLFYAARRNHVETLIKPALAAGKIVITDRFADSTHAYQCFGHGVSEDTFNQVNDLVLGEFKPDLTFLLDVPVEIGLKRSQSVNDEGQISAQQVEDRFERLDKSFHEKLRAGFLTIAQSQPQRFCVVDATLDLQSIAETLRTKTLKKLKENK